MRTISGLLALALVIAVAFPATAMAQSAGDEQYTDPFQGENQGDNVGGGGGGDDGNGQPGGPGETQAGGETQSGTVTDDGSSGTTTESAHQPVRRHLGQRHRGPPRYGRAGRDVGCYRWRVPALRTRASPACVNELPRRAA